MTRAQRGEARAFFDAALASSHDDCIIWPFADFGNDYGQVQLNGRGRRVHVEVCRRAHGDKPTPVHVAAHSCGRSRCVNPRHLRWKTPAENEADKRAHGTYNHAGAANPNAVLTAADVAEIRSRHVQRDRRGRKRTDTWANTNELAFEFGVAPATVRDIVAGRSWSPDQRA